jgi:superfamily II DNA helicase RecQ
MLAALCRSRPRDLHELSQVKGFGPAKIARYGEEIVSLVREHAGT